jgi:hypothetical protein
MKNVALENLVLFSKLGEEGNVDRKGQSVWLPTAVAPDLLRRIKPLPTYAL